MKMAELKKAVAEKAEMSQSDANQVIKACFEAISDALGNGETVQLPGFGTFSLGERAARTGRNPQTGAEIQIAASKSVKFKAGKALKDSLNG
ncbi:histone family protein DNA-binding protein [Magnetococcus marinus MC-1]|uniref:Histone family protein DNA-binding protein n=1 Tax=Magnetococcus marinus (strain ATCC BAA-1437 / JCM 17883 / MC-1) TaxID=156889 RepID=A0L719_MAGMM|nr:HU family DNA-binding protein [Magnetococcus marinus]ABK43762.1 histone family protein DNA-binding protein [Magnetococcus marinus MC-1]ABK45394.1 histone family protein DNA-binding protein [Magnetococcus marinus MC-1]